MPYCPRCQESYPPGARCPHHGGLIRRLRPGVAGDRVDDPREERLVRVATAWSEVMAQSWAELLQNNGIPCLVKVGGPGWSFGAPPPFGFEVFLLVPRGRFERAQALLEPFEGPHVLRLDGRSSGGEATGSDGH